MTGSTGRRLRFSFALLVTSLGAATFAVLLRTSLVFWYQHVFQSEQVVSAMTALSKIGRLTLPVVAGVAAGGLVVLRSAGPQNVSNVMEAVALGNLRLSIRTTLSRVAASWTAIAMGLSTGREGPLIEFGGTFGAAVARVGRTPVPYGRVLIAAGAAAGFAAAYNTPFAAIVFVLEIMLGVAEPLAVLAIATSVVLATVVTRAVVGAGPIYGQRAFAMQTPWELVLFGLLGMLAAPVASVFRRTLKFLEDLTDRYPLSPPLRGGLGGLAVGLIMVWLPQVAGNGYEPINDILDQRIALTLVLSLLIAKIAATSLCVAAGIPGGIFTPTLLVGAALGTLWHGCVSFAFISQTGQAGGYALVGMAAMTAATIQAPLTAAVLVFELSGDYPIAIPLLLATVTATITSKSIGDRSIYESELIRRGLGWRLTLEGREVMERTNS